MDLPDNGLLLGREPATERSRAVGFWSASADAGQGAWVCDASDGHAIVFAPTGAGKKRHVLMPTLLATRQPVVVMDMKGELARESADYRRRVLGHEVRILDPWGLVTPDGDRLNPLDALDPASPALADDAYALAGLLVDTAPLKEAYWDERAQAVVAGLIVHAVTGPDEPDRSFRRIWQAANGDDPIYGLALLLDTKAVHPFAHAQIANLLAITADQTRSCVLSVIHQHLRVFGSELVQRAVSETTFDLAKVRDGAPLSIYLAVPPTKLRSHAALLRAWLATLMNQVLDRRAPPEQQTLLLLDEAAQLGRMDQVPQAITLARGYGLRCILMLQSHAQLRGLYGDEAEVLMENCATLATFGHTAMGMSHQLADALGDISAERLFGMDRREIAIRRAGEATRIVTRTDYLTDPELAGLAAPNPMFAGRGCGAGTSARS